MKVKLYIRDLYAEYPLSVIKQGNIKGSEIHYGQEPYWRGVWAGEYRIFPRKQIKNEMTEDYFLERINRWKHRVENFGGLFFDPDTNAILMGDKESLDFAILIQQGCNLQEAVAKMNLHKSKLKEFFNSIWEAYNGKD